MEGGNKKKLKISAFSPPAMKATDKKKPQTEQEEKRGKGGDPEGRGRRGKGCLS